MKTSYDVKLLNGSKQEVTYNGVEKVTLPAADGSGTKTFTAGEPLDEIIIPADFSAGDMPLEAPAGKVVRSAVIQRPANAETVIAKGSALAGIPGEYVTPGTGTEIVPDFSGGDQTVQAEGDTRWNEVTLKKPETLLPENLAKGVEIAGVVGKLEVKKAPHQILDRSSGTFELCDDMFDTPPTVITAPIFSSTGVTKIALNSVSQICQSAFQYCSSLEEVSMKGLKSGYGNLYSGHYAFASCRSLVSADISNMDYIPVGFFNGCSKLKNISLSTEIKCCGYYAFRDTAFLSDMETENGVMYTANVAVSGVSSVYYSQTLTLRSTATCIGASAFYYYFAPVRMADIPQVKYISPGAFLKQRVLSTVNMPNVIEIGECAFSECSALTSVEIPLCEEIGSSAFAWCQNIQQVNLNACKELSGDAFSGCSALTSVEIPVCERVPDGAFYGCTKLSKAELPCVSRIGYNAFKSCTALMELYAPAWDIDGSAFYGCSNLSVACFFPSRKAYIGSSAFWSCVRLLSLYLLGTEVATLASANAFVNTPISDYTNYTKANGSIFVRQSLVSLYKASSSWRYLSSRIAGLTDDEVNALITEMEAKYETSNSDTPV